MTDHDTIVAMARAMAEADGVPVGAMGPACVFGGVDYLAIARRHLAAHEIMLLCKSERANAMMQGRAPVSVDVIMPPSPVSVREAAQVLRAHQNHAEPTVIDQPALPLPKKKGLKK